VILVLKKDCSPVQKRKLLDFFINKGISYHVVESKNIIVLPKHSSVDGLEVFDMIEHAYSIHTKYKLASNKWKSKTTFSVNGTEIGGDLFTMIAGPCSVENEEQIFKTAEFLSGLGVKFLRGGAYKPRTSPYSFNGLGLEGLKLLRKAADKYNMNVVTEILDFSLLDEVAAYADILQVGSRNMHNFYLLRELGKINKPVLLKRGFNGTAVEWLLSAEYILSGGNDEVILCERGIRSFDPSTRNVLDIGIIPLINELSHLPIIVDPSHGTGSASRVLSGTLAAAAAGANGVIVEVHPEPKLALSDSEQAVSFSQYDELLTKTQLVLHALGKRCDTEINALKTVSL
jgi:3-deoxy-7-phosphoheptulonate synthase